MYEIWKDVIWYEWLYQASNLWNIKSLIWWRRNTWKELILKSGNNWCWYLVVVLTKDWIRSTQNLHRIIWKTFIKNIENKPCINHKDWDKTNNIVDNLERCTYSENELHSYKILWKKSILQTNHPDKWKFGKYNRSSKKVNQYTKDWIFIKQWDSLSDATRQLSIHFSIISKCCKWVYKTAWWYKWEYTI